MLVEDGNARALIVRRLPWLASVALLLFGLDCYQSAEALRTFLLAAVILLFLHGSLFLVAFWSPCRAIKRKRPAARSISYAVVLCGAAWVAVRFLVGNRIESSDAYLDAFIIGGLSGCLYFLAKKPHSRVMAARKTER